MWCVDFQIVAQHRGWISIFEHCDERTLFRIVDRRRPAALAAPQALDPLRLGGSRKNTLRQVERCDPLHSRRHRTLAALLQTMPYDYVYYVPLPTPIALPLSMSEQF